MRLMKMFPNEKQLSFIFGKGILIDAKLQISRIKGEAQLINVIKAPRNSIIYY